MLRSAPAALAQSADILAESLVELKRAILAANMGDLSFLQRLNLKNVMNKSIKFSRWRVVVWVGMVLSLWVH